MEICYENHIICKNLFNLKKTIFCLFPVALLYFTPQLMKTEEQVKYREILLRYLNEQYYTKIQNTILI